jgi:hypothetical protein
MRRRLSLAGSKDAPSDLPLLYTRDEIDARPIAEDRLAPPFVSSCSQVCASLSSLSPTQCHAAEQKQASNTLIHRTRATCGPPSPFIVPSSSSMIVQLHRPLLLSQLSILVLLFFLVTPTTAQVVHTSLSRKSCLGTGDNVAPSDQQLVFTSLYAQLDQGQQAVGQKGDGVSLDTLPNGPLYTQDGEILSGTGDVLRLVLVGSTVTASEGYSNDTNLLSTLVLTSEVLTFEVATNSSWLCSSIRTNEGTTGTTSNGSLEVVNSGCPYSGEIALGLNIPLASSYPLTTITTSLVALDPSSPALHLACYDLSFTPYYPTYFVYPLIRYRALFLLLLFFFYSYPDDVLLLLRSRNRSTRPLPPPLRPRPLLCELHHLVERPRSDSRLFPLAQTLLPSLRRQSKEDVRSDLVQRLGRKAGRRERKLEAVCDGGIEGAFPDGSLVLARRDGRSEVARIRLFVSLSLLRPLAHIVAHNLPLSDPVFAQTAWTSLIYNNSLSFTSPAAAVLPENSTVPSDFTSQVTDVTSPLWLDSSLPNVLLDLDSSADGIERWARMIGVRHEDLWSICAFTFFSICGGIVAAHLIFFAFDSFLDAILPKRRSPSREFNDDPKPPVNGEENGSNAGLAKESGESGMRESYRGRSSEATASSYLDSGDFIDDDYLDDSADHGRPRMEHTFAPWRLHLALLQGNLTRVLLLFHLPLSLFSAYQFTLYSSSPISTFALAVITFAVVCVVIPTYLLWQLHAKSARDLYTSLPALLSLGVLYNTYAEECVLFPAATFGSNLVIGVVIGAAQTAGTAQAAIILIVEVAHTLITSLWLPYVPLVFRSFFDSN